MSSPPLNVSADHKHRGHTGQHWLDYFFDQVHLQTGRIAVRSGQIELSYQQLHEQARWFAAHFSAMGVKPGGRIAISVDRNEQSVPLLLACWYCRCAYIPLDPAYPTERKQYVLESAEVDLLVTDKSTTETWWPESVNSVEIGDLSRNPEVTPSDAADVIADVNPQDLAYIIFTSGSTGRPKGVMITHANVANFLLGMLEALNLRSTDRLLAVTTISFDIHILELFLPLMIGAQVVLASQSESRSQDCLRRMIGQYGITALQATPATWRMVLADGWQSPAPLTMLVGGEALTPDLRDLMLANSGVVWNMYGPTETTVWSTCHRVEPDDQHIYIGRAIRNTQLFIVDDDLAPVADGTPGELLIGGAGVALGYLNNPELTSTKFISFSGSSDPVYRTGDRVVRHSSGLIEYYTRIDNQIKLRGFRIEPREIEESLLSCPGIERAEVLLVEAAENDQRLVACYLGREVALTELREHCAQSLPAFMLPQHFLHFADLPLTENLKVNRRELALLAAQRLTNNGGNLQANGAPRDDLDRGLVKVWQQALGVDAVGIDDDFFELGGYSLLALQLRKDIHTVCGIDVPTSLIFTAPTIRRLRDQLGDYANSAATAIRLNQAKHGVPLFCLCGVELYQSLASSFAETRPVFGVFADEETAYLDRQTSLTFSAEDLARLVGHYADAIKRQNTPKTICLGGFSFGGFLALEVAQVLRREGYQVTGIIMIDSYFSQSAYRSKSRLLSDLYQSVKENGIKNSVGKGRTKIHSLLRRPTDHRQQRKYDIAKADRNRERIYDKAVRCFERNVGQYRSRVLLIKATGNQFGFGNRAYSDYGLKQLIQGEIEVVELPGKHADFMHGSSVDSIREAIELHERNS